MKKSFLFILACITFFPFTARSQNEGIKAVANPLPEEGKALQTRSTREMAMLQEQGTTGGAAMPSGINATNSPLYLEPGWVAGSVELRDNSGIGIIMLRYDIYHQQIQFIKGKDTLAFAKPEEVAYFMLGDKKIIYTDYQGSGTKGKSYFEVLSDGGCRLLQRRIVKYHLEPDVSGNLKDELYIRENEFYIEKNGDVAKPIRACRKSVLCAFNDKEDEIKAFMEQNDLKMNCCEELKQVVAYYNTLE
jgi:hypothetical protein